MNDLKKIPLHVAMIMDGNGRWAAAKGKDRVEGHIEGVRSIRVITEEAVKYGIRYVSFFAFSEENWARPEGEVSALMKLMLKSVQEEVETLVRNNVRFKAIGNRERLPLPLQTAIGDLEKMTEFNTALTMSVFLSYSGKWDISQAALKMAAAGDDDLEKYLSTRGMPDPDLIIRTSGEQRISNFLLWQAAYSEFVFTDTLWPDFREDGFRAALEEYAGRDRRYGKVNY